MAERSPARVRTFLFSDLEGSTRLFEEHPAAMQHVVAHHEALTYDAVAAHGGRVVKLTGDGAHAVFETAPAAVDAAVTLQRAIGDAVWPEGLVPRLRIGVHTGTAVERAGDYFGPEVNRAARIMAAAHGGQIVCSEATRVHEPRPDRFLDLGTHRLRDLQTTVHLFQVVAPGLPVDFPPLRSLDAYRSNLPFELSEFIGRGDDIAAVGALLGDARLVSIVGTGGVGKTRLAVRVGSEQLPRFGDGVWLCELAPLVSDQEIPEAVAAAVGYVPTQGTPVAEGLRRFLEAKRALLVLDNCEHLVAGAARFVEDLLERAAGLAVLTTTREALGVRGERVYPLPSLTISLDASPDDVLASDAGALFAVRARNATGSFEVDEWNAVAVRDLCARLDGIPLAIELAAARTIAMDPTEILARLDTQFRLLTGGSRTALERHRTLRAAIDWSYELLGPAERAVLSRCSVFVGGFDLPAVVALTADLDVDELDITDHVTSLVAKSLIERVPGRQSTRYRLLDMIRQYAGERLDADEAAAARDRHADHYLRLTTDLYARASTADGFDALEQLEPEAFNLGAACRWLLDRERGSELLAFFHALPFVDPVTVPVAVADELGRAAAEAAGGAGAARAPGFPDACFAASMRPFMDGDLAAYGAWTDRGARGMPSARLDLNQAAIAILDGDVALALEHGDRAIRRAREHGSAAELAFALALVAAFAHLADEDRGIADATEAVEVARSTGSAVTLVYPLAALSATTRWRDPDGAIAAAEECVRIDRSQRRSWSSSARGAAGFALIARGDVERGLAQYRQSVEHLAETRDRWVLSVLVATLARALASPDPEGALELAAIAESTAIASFSVLDAEPELARLAERRPDEWAQARTRADDRTFASSVARVLEVIDELSARRVG